VRGVKGFSLFICLSHRRQSADGTDRGVVIVGRWVAGGVQWVVDCQTSGMTNARAKSASAIVLA